MNRQLIRSYILLVAVAILLFTVPVAFTLTKQLRDDTKVSVQREAQTMALLLGNGDRISCEALEKVAKAYDKETRGTVQVATTRCTTNLPRPEKDAALTRAVRDDEASTDWGSDFIWGKYLTITVPAQGDSAVRIVYSTSDMTSRFWSIWGFRAALAALVLAAAAAIGAVAARRITAPLRELNGMASKFSDGDLTARSQVTGPPETQTLARTLNQGAERLDTLVASQRIFVADASHQLRTPLTALRLSLDNIADGTDDEFVREDVEQATAEVVRMSRLVNGLLVLARAEAKVTAAEPPSCGTSWTNVCRCGGRPPTSAGSPSRSGGVGVSTAGCSCWPAPVIWTRCWTTCCPTPWRSHPTAGRSPYGPNPGARRWS